MRYQNNAVGAKNGRKNILIAIGLIVLIALFILLSLRDKNDNLKTTGYIDEGSGQVVSSPVGKVEESAGNSSAQELLFLGMHSLIDIGVSQYQLDATKQAFLVYKYESGKAIQVVSVTLNSVKRIAPDKDSGDTRDIVEFSGTFNRTDVYKAQLEYTSNLTARLRLVGNDGVETYNSGDITTTTGD